MDLDVVYNEDCMIGMKKIPNESIDLLVTDCPYHIVSGGCTTLPRDNEPSGIFNRRNTFTQENAKNGKLFNNNDIEFKEWLPEVYRIMKEETHAYIMINARNLKELQQECENAGFEFQQLLVWNKKNVTPNRYWMNGCEFILMMRKGNAKNLNDMSKSNIITMNNIMGNKNHPTEKPVALMEELISNSSSKGDIVLDPFMGSGSTALACMNLHRHYIGYEIDEKYYDVAQQRIKDNFSIFR